MARARSQPAAARVVRPAAVTEMRMPFVIYHIQPLDIDRLCTAEHNPPERADTKSRQQVLDLAEAILTTGVCAPIWVEPESDSWFKIIEGHRRWTALRFLDSTHAPCCVYPGDPRRLYAFLNANQKALDTCQQLFNYLVDPLTVLPKKQREFSRMEEVVGREGMEAVRAKGGSLATFKQARQVARYCGIEKDNGFVAQALQWLMTHDMTRAVRVHMEQKLPHIALFAAVRKNVPIS